MTKKITLIFTVTHSSIEFSYHDGDRTLEDKMTLISYPKGPIRFSEVDLIRYIRARHFPNGLSGRLGYNLRKDYLAHY